MARSSWCSLISRTFVSVLSQKYRHSILTSTPFRSLLHASTAVSSNHSNKNDRHYEGSYNSSESQKEDIPQLKQRILEASLQYVPEHGWSKSALSLGAKSIGLSSAAHGLIQAGEADLVHYFNFQANQKLDSHLKQRAESQAENEKISLPNFLEDALKFRLGMVIPYVSHWPKAVALMISPSEAATSLQNLLDLVDIVWLNYGDKSINLTWYSKRLSLAAIYRLCELSLIQDRSPEYSDTFDFLQRRVEAAVEFTDRMSEIGEVCKHLPEFGAGMLITAVNISGASRWFR